MKQEIYDRLQDSFLPSYLEVIDESNLHAGHKGAPVGGNSHFRIKISSSAFVSISKIESHRLIYKALEQWMNHPIHALAIEIF